MEEVGTEGLFAAFAEAAARLRSGTIGSELQSTYPPESRIVLARTFWGDEMEVVVPEIVGCELDRYGLIEPGVTRLFLEFVARGSVVFDVGAHLGYFSLLASRLGADAHSFEPSEMTLLRLHRNLGDHASIVPKGVWSTSGSRELKDFGPQYSAVNTFLSPKDGTVGAPHRTTSVEVLSLDDHVSATGAIPNLIKIDAEGAEAEVLEGARRTIDAHRPIITVEVGDLEGTPSSRDVLDLASSMGYELFDITPEGRAPHVLKDRYGYGNVALLP